MGFIIFISLFVITMGLMNLYIWRRFIRKLTHGVGRYFGLVPAILMAGDIAYIVDRITGFLPESLAVYVIASTFIGMTFMLFVVAVVYDLSVTASKRVPFDQDRRRAIKLGFDVTILILAFSYLFKGFVSGIRMPDINRIKVAIKDFPHDKFTLVQLTDVHVGRTIKRDFVEHIVAETNRLKPDIVVITGDLVDFQVSRIEYDLYPLKDIEAPTYFILGNHEYFHGAGESVAYLRTLGIKPLLNDHVCVGEGNAQFNLVGLTDVSGARANFLPPDLTKAYDGCDQGKACVVLAHQPKMIEQMQDYRCDLMLSGHTHGGQIFPFGLLVMAAQPYLAGLYQHTDASQIFVSRGTGYWGPPLRFMAPSEISHITLTAS